MTRHVQMLLVAVAAFLLGWVTSQQVPALHAQQTNLVTKNLVGQDVQVRPVGVNEWAKAKKFGVEVVQDRFGNLLYITETGAIAVTPAK